MNVLSVTGRLTGDPARRDTSKGVVCEFRIAVDGQRRMWLPVTCWGHLAGLCARHLRAGRRVAVSGQLRVDEYLTLLTVAQTCEYQGLDFLDFLRSGEKDVETFARGRQRYSRQQNAESSGQPCGLRQVNKDSQFTRGVAGVE